MAHMAAAAKGKIKTPPQAVRGLFVVLSSPSGAGKSSISRRLLRAEPKLFLSVSATTRRRRPNEVDGQDYHFISREEFDARRARKAFLESATVFGNAYGTPRAPIERALKEGRDILFDIDWQGAQRLAEHERMRLVRVFILPPSAAALATRLKTRAQDTPEERRRRMRGAAAEIEHYAEYEYVLVNRDLADAVNGVRAIIRAERTRASRQPDLAGFVGGLLRQLGK